MMIDVSVQSDFLSALLSGNRVIASRVIFDLLGKDVPINDIYEKVIKQALYKIGDFWEAGSISVATEHLASAIVQAIQNELYSSIISQKKIPKTVVLACVENEQHQIGIKMVADVFEMNEWNSHFLGAGVPLVDLIRFMKNSQPHLLALSVSMHYNLLNLETALQAIRKEIPDLFILIGGQAFNKGGYELFLNHSNVLYFNGLYELESFLSKKPEF
ncbi:MAG: cobalamin-dependent protein [Bacteroidales bacterium]|nr:cobalamin-dependent protein [Bacteroidales bacterium]